MGEVLWLARTQRERGAVAREVGSGEVGIEAAVRHAVAGGVPGRGRGLDCQRVSERQINDEEPARLRLARCNEHQEEEGQPPHRRGSTKRLYLRSAARSRSCGSAYTRVPL